MIKIIILVLACIAILLCLLQNDKSEGLLSLSVKSYSTKNERNKRERYLNIGTTIVISMLFIALFLEMI